MNTPDNFDALKDNFFQSIREARTKHVTKGMCTVSTKDEYWPARVSVMQPTNGTATVSVNVSLLSSCGTKMDADELRLHAAHCLAAAEEIEQAKAEAAAIRPEPATAA